jgi:hypothetical protein
MDKMIGGGKREPDPVCAAATKAYWYVIMFLK